MKNKRIAALCLSGVLILGGVTGCKGADETGSKSSDDTENSESTGEESAGISGEVRYAFWDTIQVPWLEACVEEFNKIYPDVKIILEPNVWDEYWTKLEAAATGGSLADVFWMNGPNIAKYAQGDILLPIDDQIAESGIDLSDYPKGTVDQFHIEGKQYAIPKDFGTINVWYNKKLFDEAGVEYPTDDWTWEDMAEKAEKLTKPDGSIYGIAAPYDGQTCFYNTIFAHGGEIISEDKKSSGYDKPETQAGIQCWIDLQEAGLSPSQASLEEATADAQFLSGKVAMAWIGSWLLPSVLESDVKDDVDCVEVPSIKGKKGNTAHGLGNCIFKGTKNPEAAWAWVEFLASETPNVLSAEMGAAIPALKGTSQKWIDTYPQYNLKSYITAAEEYSYEYPASVNTAEWNQYEADNLKKAYALEVDVKTAADQLAKQMNEVLSAE